MPKTNILNFSLDKLKDEMQRIGQKPFRARQLFEWIYKKRVFDFDLMSDISLAHRQQLKELYSIDFPKIAVRKNSEDGTVKLLVELEDKQLVETVLMRYNYGNSICVTTQVGCLMACKFCASGLLKKIRNLTTAEIVGQFLVLDQLLREESQNNEKLSHCVIMGTGEPFDNYENVMDYIKILNCPYGLEIGARHITVSTCGITPRIRDFGKEHLQVNLAISLHAPNDEIRNKIMPINSAYPLKDLIDAVNEYTKESGGRRVTFEYIMIENLNSSLENARELAKLIKDTGGYVNLIPYNEVEENDFKRCSNNQVFRFRDELNHLGIKATIRKEFGSDIEAACGQLRAKYSKKK